MTSPNFDTKAFERVRKNYKIDCDRLDKEVEAQAADNLMRVLFDPVDQRFLAPKREDYDKVSLDVAKREILKQLVSNNMVTQQVCIEC